MEFLIPTLIPYKPRRVDIQLSAAFVSWFLMKPLSIFQIFRQDLSSFRGNCYDLSSQLSRYIAPTATIYHGNCPEEQQGVGEGHPPNNESCQTHYEGARVQQQEPHLELG